jgi:hypothetical protein
VEVSGKRKSPPMRCASAGSDISELYMPMKPAQNAPLTRSPRDDDDGDDGDGAGKSA